jgi:signal transduction histidine kinase
LEEQVSTRTADLAATNQTLEHEISERRRAQDDLQAYSGQLEKMVEARSRELLAAQEQLIRQERLAMLGQLAGGVGHELRSPLAVISNAVYLLKLVQPNADEQVREYLGLIEQETRTSEKIITDLLDFSRVKPGKIEEVRLAALIERVLIRFPIPANIALAVNLPEKMPVLQVDPLQVEQVLGNLVINACQAMPDGGKLVISAQETVTDGRTHVAIHVEDTGTGISSENMNKIFTPLFSTKSRGIGLGLAVCKMLTEANAGRIEVQSEPGVGSIFTLYLPGAP